MTRAQFLAWGAIWHYPFLALSREQPLRHGKAAYESATPAMVRAATKRIERWNELACRPRVDQAIGIVDELLTSRSGTETMPERERVHG